MDAFEKAEWQRAKNRERYQRRKEAVAKAKVKAAAPGKEMEVDAQICNQLVARGSPDNPSEVCGGMVMVEHDFGADLDSDALADESMGVEADDSCSSSAESFLG